MGVLQGTFDTLGLTEVLGLLATSSKTGALWLKAGSVEGRIYLADGRCCAAESTDLLEPVRSDPELESRLVDVCFLLARQDGGSFRFVVDDEPNWRVDGRGVAVDDAVDSLGHLLEEWREIQRVIPSLEARPQLAAELGSDSIIIDQLRWRLLVCLDGRRSVREVMHHTKRSVLDVCNALKDLIEDGAVEIAPDVPSVLPAHGHHAPEHGAERGHLPVPEPHDAPAANEASTPDPFAGAEPEADNDVEPPAESDAAAKAVAQDDVEALVSPADLGPQEAAAYEEADPRDRGALLRLFSALRET
jgi:uncharacterized protein DUF4388